MSVHVIARDPRLWLYVLFENAVKVVFMALRPHSSATSDAGASPGMAGLISAQARGLAPRSMGAALLITGAAITAGTRQPDLIAAALGLSGFPVRAALTQDRRGDTGPMPDRLALLHDILQQLRNPRTRGPHPGFRQSSGAEPNERPASTFACHHHSTAQWIQ